MHGNFEDFYRIVYNFFVFLRHDYNITLPISLSQAKTSLKTGFVWNPIDTDDIIKAPWEGICKIQSSEFVSKCVVAVSEAYFGETVDHLEKGMIKVTLTPNGRYTKITIDCIDSMPIQCSQSLFDTQLYAIVNKIFKCIFKK
jgi:hypothetical protein